MTLLQESSPAPPPLSPSSCPHMKDAIGGPRCAVAVSDGRAAARVQAPALAPAPASGQLNPSAHIPALDGLRGLAVLLVMCTHANLLAAGYIGVDMFFVLSGFLITTLLLRERRATGRVNLPNFYMRRVLRLAPALLLVVGLFVALGPLLVPIRWARALGDAGIVVFYSANWTRAFGNRPGLLGHAWSLSIEEQFYFLWPALMLGLYAWLGRWRRAGLVCLLAAGMLTAWRYWMLAHGASDKRVYNGLDTHGDDLLYGAALAFFNVPLSRRAAAFLGWIGVGGLAWIVASAGRPFGPHPYVFVSLFTGVLIVSLVQRCGGVLDRVLSFPALVWTGTISYGLYLYHFPIMDYLASWKHAGTAAVVAVGFPLAFALATMSFYFVERPCLRLKERFRFSGSVSSKPAGAEMPLASA